MVPRFSIDRPTILDVADKPTTDTGSKNKGIPSLISAAPATDDIDGPKIYTVKTIGTCNVRKPSPDPSIADWCQHIMGTDGGMVELLYDM